MWHPCAYVQKIPLQRVHWPELERPASLPSDSDALFIPLPSQHLIVLPSITNMFLDYSSLSLFLPHPFSPPPSLPHSPTPFPFLQCTCVGQRTTLGPCFSPGAGFFVVYHCVCQAGQSVSFWGGVGGVFCLCLSSCPLAIGTLGLQTHVAIIPRFMWVLGIRIQLLLLAWQLHPSELPPNLLVFFFFFNSV